MRCTTFLVGILGLGLDASPVLAAAAPAGAPWGKDAVRVGAPVAGAGYRGFLKKAEDALQHGRYALANELVERAEARLLTRATVAAKADLPDDSSLVQTLARARVAIGRHDQGQALRLIAQATARPRAGAPSGLD